MVRFSKHATLKLKQRKIPRHYVLRTIQEPDHIEELPSNRWAAYKKFHTLVLKVVYCEDVGGRVVVTEHWIKSLP